MAEKRLIDADKLADEFYHMPELVYTDAIARCIEMQPTVDAVQVVRCKDCKHRNGYECNHIMLGNTKCGVTDDWFCADGERIGGDSDG